jgi:hypothetical protein
LTTGKAGFTSSGGRHSESEDEADDEALSDDSADDEVDDDVDDLDEVEDDEVEDDEDDDEEEVEDDFDSDAEVLVADGELVLVEEADAVLVADSVAVAELDDPPDGASEDELLELDPPLAGLVELSLGLGEVGGVPVVGGVLCDDDGEDDGVLDFVGGVPLGGVIGFVVFDGFGVADGLFGGFVELPAVLLSSGAIPLRSGPSVVPSTEPYTRVAWKREDHRTGVNRTSRPVRGASTIMPLPAYIATWWMPRQLFE